MPSVRDQGELEPYLGRRAALHLHFARLRAEAWRGHTHAVGTLRQRGAGCVSNNRRRRPPRAGRTNPQFLADPLTYERPASPARASISLSSGPQPSHEVPTHGGLTRPRRRLLRGSPATRATCSPASTASPT